MIKVAIAGAAGRMGRILVSLVLNDKDLQLSAALEQEGSAFIGQDAGLLAGEDACGVLISSDIEAVLQNSDCIIDFTAPAATLKLAELSAAKGVHSVIGTTGLTADEKLILQKLAANGAHIVFAPNMSIGVNLLFSIAAKTAAALGEDYDIEIIEMHHNQKKDAPSGTAERLGEVLAQARGLDYQKDCKHGRLGMPGARSKNEIGMHAIRGGDVVGDHTVIFATDGERIELTHKASSRETFAKGALRAVKFLQKNKAGLYDMQDVLIRD